MVTELRAMDIGLHTNLKKFNDRIDMLRASLAGISEITSDACIIQICGRTRCGDVSTSQARQVNSGDGFSDHNRLEVIEGAVLQPAFACVLDDQCVASYVSLTHGNTLSLSTVPRSTVPRLDIAAEIVCSISICRVRGHACLRNSWTSNSQDSQDRSYKAMGDSEWNCRTEYNTCSLLWSSDYDYVY